jgi:hypothetical protein
MGAHAGLTAETTARANTGAPATKKKRKHGNTSGGDARRILKSKGKKTNRS